MVNKPFRGGGGAAAQGCLHKPQRKHPAHVGRRLALGVEGEYAVGVVARGPGIEFVLRGMHGVVQEELVRVFFPCGCCPSLGEAHSRRAQHVHHPLRHCASSQRARHGDAHVPITTEIPSLGEINRLHPALESFLLPGDDAGSRSCPRRNDLQNARWEDTHRTTHDAEWRVVHVGLGLEHSNEFVLRRHNLSLDELAFGSIDTNPAAAVGDGDPRPHRRDALFTAAPSALSDESPGCV